MATGSEVGHSADPFEPFPGRVFRGSRSFFAGLVAVSGGVAAAFAAVGSLVLATLAMAYTAWAGYRLIAPGRLRVTRDGILDETFWYSPGLIPWDEITDIRPTRFGLVEIDLVDETAYVDRLGPWAQLALIKQQLYGFGPALIVPWVLRGTRRDLVEGLQEGLDAHTLRVLTQSGNDVQLPTIPERSADGDPPASAHEPGDADGGPSG